MFGSSIDQLTRSFEGRFEAVGDGYLFRPKPTAPPVRLSEGEMRDCVSDFRRGVWWVLGGVMVLTLALIIGSAYLFPSRNMRGIEGYGIIVIILAAFLAPWWRLWTLPERRFARRAPAGLGYTKAEVRVRTLLSVRWVNLGIGAVVIAALIGFELSDPRTTTQEKWFWSLIGLVMTALILVQSYRKWKHRRENG
jgi:hypothetical protein